MQKADEYKLGCWVEFELELVGISQSWHHDLLELE